MRKIASFVIGAFAAASSTPTVSKSAILPWRATSRMAPGIWPFSESARSVVTIRPRRSDDSPTCSGLTLDRVWAWTSATVDNHSSAASSAIFLFIGVLSRFSDSLQRDRLDAEIEARMQLEALHALGVRGGLDLVVDEHPRRVVDQDALGLAVQLRALLLVGGEPRLVQQLVVLLVLVERAVGTVRRPLARVQQRVHHQIRGLVAGHPREREQVLLFRAQLGEVGAPLHRLQRDIDADRLEVGLDN